MYISDAFHLIFIRVPRTGSTAMLRALETAFPDLRMVGKTHGTIADAAGWKGYRTFGTIRHPWRWFVSAYQLPLVINIAGNEANSEVRGLSFPDWVRARKTTPMDWLDDGGVRVDEIRLFEDFVQRSHVVANMSAPYNYQEWYTPDLAEYVARKCHREIEIGGYEFDR